jgi:hypothetical protein
MFAPEVQFRALLPAGLREAHSPFEEIKYYQQWFAVPECFEMIGHTIVSPR